MWNNRRTMAGGKKYHSHEVAVDGVTFASKKEARRYLDLKLMEQTGRIKGLELQKKYILIPAQREPDTFGPRGGKIKGKLLEKECAYYADFVYREVVPFAPEEEYPVVVEDTKGFRTEAYKIKKKLMLYVHGVRIREV